MQKCKESSKETKSITPARFLPCKGAQDENNDDWTLVKSEYQKPTGSLLDAKTVAGLFVHVIKKSPCVRGASATIMHSCVARHKTHLERL